MTDWGSVPEWVAAIGSTIALLVAIGLLALELSRNGTERGAKRRSQAAKVAAWIKASDTDEYDVIISNNSDEPVFEVAFWIAEADVRVPDSDWTLLGTLGPGETRTFSYASAGESLRGVNLSFRDNAGVSWRRVGDGTLKEDPHPPTFC